jgi:hypothetical protein
LSGGRWGYAGKKVEWEVEEFVEDRWVSKNMPLTAKTFRAFARAFRDIEHSVDWMLSGDGAPDLLTSDTEAMQHIFQLLREEFDDVG